MKRDEPPIDPALPTTVTPSGRVVYDPSKAAKVEVDLRAARELQQIFQHIGAAENADARESVPQPVELRPASDGALITQVAQDAAKAHAEMSVPAGAAPAKVDSAPVKIQDPRRLPTARIVRPSPVPGAGATGLEVAGGPSSEAPSSHAPASTSVPSKGRSPERRSTRGLVGVVAAAAVCAVIAFLVLRGPPRVPADVGATGGPGVTGAGTGTGAAAGRGAGSTSVDGTAGTAAEAVTAVAPAPTGVPGGLPSPTASAGATGGGVKSVPSGEGDPYGDGGVPSVQTAPTGGPAAPVATGVPAVPGPPATTGAPAASAPATSAPATSAPATSAPAPTAAPAATPKGTGDEDFYIRSRKKDAAKP